MEEGKRENAKLVQSTFGQRHDFSPLNRSWAD